MDIAHYCAPGPPHADVGTLHIGDVSKAPKLFHHLKLHDVELKNRVVVSPMCMYSAHDGFPSPFHLVHLGSFALHGAGLIFVEATSVQFNGRISPRDLGLWKDEQTPAYKSLVESIKTCAPGVKMAIQLGHAGRKASNWEPFAKGPRQNQWFVSAEEGGWPDDVVAPSSIAYSDGWVKPRELSKHEIEQFKKDFVDSVKRAITAGFDVVEIHAAHGYLFHEFMSPESNHRTDEYGNFLIRIGPNNSS
jgi:2,4-dienoyl-CoA reductase-like NADH-dependent reductase (Old Yellow Enzyme family)